jgi:flagellar basal-body rod protein FlgB
MRRLPVILPISGLRDTALDSSGAADLSEIEAQIHQLNTTPVKSNGNDVNLEVEVGEMVKNTLRHKVYIRVLSKKYRQMELAISTGK